MDGGRSGVVPGPGQGPDPSLGPGLGQGSAQSLGQDPALLGWAWGNVGRGQFNENQLRFSKNINYFCKIVSKPRVISPQGAIPHLTYACIFVFRHFSMFSGVITECSFLIRRGTSALETLQVAVHF